MRGRLHSAQLPAKIGRAVLTRATGITKETRFQYTFTALHRGATALCVCTWTRAPIGRY